MIVGVLTWYEETTKSLIAAVSSASTFIDHLVAVDGAYHAFPEARRGSGPEQQEQILSLAQSLGLGVTMHVPHHVWFGNEVEKRSYSLALGQLAAGSDRDWLFLFDADEVVSHVPEDLRRRLEATDLDVAQCTLWERWDGDQEEEQLVPGASVGQAHPRKFYRALPGIQVVGSHYCYAVPDGDGFRWLWGNPYLQDLEEALNLDDFEVEHRHRYRNPYRRRMAHEFYHLRDRSGMEEIPARDETAEAAA